MQDVDAQAAAIERDGYTILEGVIEPELVAALLQDLQRLEEEFEVQPSRNLFEGTRTGRIYNLLAHGPLYERVPIHPAVLPLGVPGLDRGRPISALPTIAHDPR